MSYLLSVVVGDPVHVWVAPAGAEPRAAAHNLLLDLASTLISSPSLHHDSDGRPHVPGLAVSLSHTHDLVVVAAAADGPIGVDVEELHPREVRELANRWFAPEELDWMSTQSSQLKAFLLLWTAKEAVGKALGRGLRQSGLRRPMPLGGGAVESEPSLLVTYVPWKYAVLAVAAPIGLTEIVVRHETALRSVERSRTSLPVVVRGN
ncbi:4'-phosphopantetheinyl transferase family protein [Kribbella kalugense]|uniref:Phosphopantetheine--protein transferase-like protein n=1 Tax=Kribbella kalugense TaxID=2512221 RepID=A0A4R7ZI33_9ACTN|nr:4'-phosphopantetheinyl transferase superfamily protein [Kribbella kalugense]TDW17042.1 phosphopantetheine--protein transferase-like protein [Kribbella kalugense]